MIKFFFFGGLAFFAALVLIPTSWLPAGTSTFWPAVIVGILGGLWAAK